MLRAKKLDSDAVLPARQSDGAAGYDLCTLKGTTLQPGQRAVLPTAIAIDLDGKTGIIKPRSGLAVKHGIDVSSMRGARVRHMEDHISQRRRNMIGGAPGHRGWIGLVTLVFDRCQVQRERTRQ